MIRTMTQSIQAAARLTTQGVAVTGTRLLTSATQGGLPTERRFSLGPVNSWGHAKHALEPGCLSQRRVQLRAHSAAAEPALGAPRKVFVQHTIYKGKAAVTFSPVSPKFVLAQGGGLALEREGALLLNFARKLGERQYDWSNKQFFALSVLECGAIAELGPGERLEFYHDPNKNTPNEGVTSKKLRIEPAPARDGKDDGTIFMSLMVTSPRNNTRDQLSVPFTKAEFGVLRTATKFILPHLMGWDAFTTPNVADNVMVPDPNYSPEGGTEEWDR